MKKILFIGGTGVMSSTCSKRALEQGFNLYHLNRGKSLMTRPVEGVKTLIGDVRDIQTYEKLIGGIDFDVVVNWLAYEKEHVELDIQLFKERVGQYILISSASAYQTPPDKLPVTEETPLINPYWEYSRKKIACEQVLKEEFKKNGFPFTIVRPSHTYDKTKIPLPGGYTTLKRMMDGRPVVVPGDGTSIWTLTHAKDFARGFVGLIGNKEAIAESFHITSEDWLTWNQIFLAIAKALGVEAKLIPVPSEVIASYDAELGAGLLGDKAHSMLFDNSKIKKWVPGFQTNIPFSEGANEIVAWYQNHPESQLIDQKMDEIFDLIISKMEKLY